VAAVCAAVALTVAPWTARNAIALHGFAPVSTESGPTLIGTYNDTSRHDPSDPGTWWLPREVPSARAIMSRVSGEPERDRALTAAAIGYAAARPAYVALVLERNTARLMGVMPQSRWRMAGEGLSMPPAAGEVAVIWFWVVLALAGAGVLTGAARGAPRFVWIAAALMFLSAAVVIAGVRFRMPVEPFVVMAAGAALARLARGEGAAVSGLPHQPMGARR
jgi:hypothetical protein